MKPYAYSCRARLRRKTDFPKSLSPLWKLSFIWATALWLLSVAPQRSHSATIADYWGKVYKAETITLPSAARAKPTLPPAEEPLPSGGLSRLTEAITFRYGMEYTRNLVVFTDRPTRTFIVDGEASLVMDPVRGTTNFPSAFEDSDDRIYSYLSMGTRALGSSRLRTYVSLVTYHDLDSNPEGNAFINLPDGLHGNNRTDLINAYADILGLAEQGPLSQVQARLGRQFAFDYDSWLLGSAVVDGVSLRYRRGRSDLTAFFGWREAFFADPSSRFATGGSFGFQILPRTTARVDFFHYQSSQRYAAGIKQMLGPLYVDTHIAFINADPIEVGIRAGYNSYDSPWTVYGSFLQQLSANDFIYDVWFTSRDQDRIRRLNLFRISPASQFLLEVDRQVFWWLSVGVGGWFRFLNDGRDQGPFDNSFQEGTVRLLLTPLPQWDYFAQYRYRHIERGPGGNFRASFPFIITDDIRRSGETSYQEISAEARYRWQNRLRVLVGGYFRLLDTQTPYPFRRTGVRLSSIDTGGLYAGFQFRLTEMVDLKFQYGVDSDYREFNPDIDLAHTFRVGVYVHYN